MTIYDVIRDALDTYPSNSDDTVAIDVLNRLRVNRTAAEALHPLVENAVANMRRQRVRELERTAFSRPWRGRLVNGDAHDVIEARAQLLKMGFFVPDGRYVAWATATVEDHEARIEMLEAQRAGLAATVKFHRQAIAAIQAAGVTCLAEIESAA